MMEKFNSKEIYRFHNRNTKDKKLKVTDKECTSILNAYFEMKTSQVIVGRKATDLFGIGRLQIIKILRKETDRAVDWGTSYANKNKIIAEGNIPYKVLERDNNGKPIKDNGGIPWIVYFNNDNQPWYLRTVFKLHTSVKREIKGISYYTFQVGKVFKRQLAEFLGETEEEQRHNTKLYNEQLIS